MSGGILDGVTLISFAVREMFCCKWWRMMHKMEQDERRKGQEQLWSGVIWTFRHLSFRRCYWFRCMGESIKCKDAALEANTMHFLSQSMHDCILSILNCSALKSIDLHIDLTLLKKKKNQGNYKATLIRLFACKINRRLWTHMIFYLKSDSATLKENQTAPSFLSCVCIIAIGCQKNADQRITANFPFRFTAGIIIHSLTFNVAAIWTLKCSSEHRLVLK